MRVLPYLYVYTNFRRSKRTTFSTGRTFLRLRYYDVVSFVHALSFSLSLPRTAASPLERIDSSLIQYYNNMPDFAISPGTGHISDWGDREERKKRLIEDSCRNLDIVSDT